MSTRAMVEFYDGTPSNSFGPYVLLYHHSDGYPEFLYSDIDRRLNHAKKYVTESPCFWWDATRVDGMFVAWSVGKYSEPDLNPDNATFYAFEAQMAKEKGRKPVRNGKGYGVPAYLPYLSYAGDIEYLYRVYIWGVGNYEVHCFQTIGLWWENTPEVPASDEYLLRLELTKNGLLRRCPKCGLRLDSRNRDKHACTASMSHAGIPT